MIIAAYIVFTFNVLQLLVSLINLIFREKPPAKKTEDEPLVSILIPARNEELNIGILLSDLLRQNYSNIEIIVFDDQSEDRTAEIVGIYAAKDKRIKLIKSDGLPAGWLGKNYACNSLAMIARGRYLLFLEADVRISGNIIASIVQFASTRNLSLVSIFPKQIMVTRGEKNSVPVMNYILLSLLPLMLVRKSFFPSLAAASGKFMFFERDIYKLVLPHQKLRANMVGDIETARMLKKLGYRIACLTGNNEVRCRMYRGFGEAVNGFSKNIAYFFGNSLLLAFLFWIVTTLGFIPVVTSLSAFWIIAYLLIYLLTRVFVSLASEQKVLINISRIVPQQISLGFFILRALRNRIKED